MFLFTVKACVDLAVEVMCRLCKLVVCEVNRVWACYSAFWFIGDLATLVHFVRLVYAILENSGLSTHLKTWYRENIGGKIPIYYVKKQNIQKHFLCINISKTLYTLYRAITIVVLQVDIVNKNHLAP